MRDILSRITRTVLQGLWMCLQEKTWTCQPIVFSYCCDVPEGKDILRENHGGTLRPVSVVFYGHPTFNFWSMTFRVEVLIWVKYNVFWRIYADNAKNFGDLRRSNKVAKRRTWLIVRCESIHWTNRRDFYFIIRWCNTIGLLTATQSLPLNQCACFILATQKSGRSAPLHIWHLHTQKCRRTVFPTK